MAYSKPVQTPEDAVADLQREVEELRRENKKLADEVKAGLMTGYMIRTKNPNYNERTMGIQFRNGKAFIPDGEKAEELIKNMKGDFGYEVERVENLKKLPVDEQTTAKRNFVESLMIPTMT